MARQTNDISYLGIHQLVTNGAEWVDLNEGPSRLNLGDDKPGTRDAGYVGEPPSSFNVQTIKKLTIREASWDAVEKDTYHGFRVVFERLR